MRHTFIVTIETDDNNLDSPTTIDLANEITSNLEYDAHSIGIHYVDVQTIEHNYRESVITGGIEGWPTL